MKFFFSFSIFAPRRESEEKVRFSEADFSEIRNRQTDQGKV